MGDLSVTVIFRAAAAFPRRLKDCPLSQPFRKILWPQCCQRVSCSFQAVRGFSTTFGKNAYRRLQPRKPAYVVAVPTQLVAFGHAGALTNKETPGQATGEDEPRCVLHSTSDSR